MASINMGSNHLSSVNMRKNFASLKYVPGVTMTSKQSARTLQFNDSYEDIKKRAERQKK